MEAAALLYAASGYASQASLRLARGASNSHVVGAGATAAWPTRSASGRALEALAAASDPGLAIKRLVVSTLG